MKKPRLTKSGARAGRSRKRASPGGSLTAKQVILSPVEAVKALAKAVRVVGGAVASPFRLASRANKEHKAKKASKAQALAALRFSRMAPRYQKDVIRTRRRLFDDL